MPDRQLVDETWHSLGPRLSSVFHAAVTPYALLSLDHRFVEVNAAYSSMTGRSREDCIGRHLFDVFPENAELVGDAPAQQLVASFDRVTESGLPDSMSILRFDVADASGAFSRRYWNVTNIPIADGSGGVEMILVHAEEVTGFLEPDDHHSTDGESPSHLSAVAEVFTSELSRLRSLNDFASALVGASNPGEVGRAVCRDGLELAGASAGSLVLLDGDMFSTIASRGVTTQTVVKWERFENDVGNEPFADAIATGESLFFEDRTALLEAYPSLADELRLHPHHHAFAVVPLTPGDGLAGAIGLVYDRPQTFPTALRLVLYTLANLTAQAASRAQLLAEQSTAMLSILDTLRPHLDPIPGVTVSHLYRPATLDVAAGGDFYDVLSISDSASLVLIGDVANHGAVAVGEMSRTRATVHALASTFDDPADIATSTDRLIARLASTHTTAVVAVFDHRTRLLTWTTAGHPVPVVVDRAGATTMLDGTHGAPLGTGFTTRYERRERLIARGETIVFYTDGLIERPGEEIDHSTRRLLDAITAHRLRDRLAERLFTTLLPTGRHRDDVAVLTLRVD